MFLLLFMGLISGAVACLYNVKLPVDNEIF